MFEQVKHRAAAAKIMNLPYTLNLEAVLESLSASSNQGSVSSKSQAMAPAGKQSPSMSSKPSKSPASPLILLPSLRDPAGIFGIKNFHSK